MADPIDRMLDDLRAEQAGETARDPLGRLLEELWDEAKSPPLQAPQASQALQPEAPRPAPPAPPPLPPRLPVSPATQARRAPPPLPPRRPAPPSSLGSPALPGPPAPHGSPERAIAQLAEEERKKKKERAETWLRALDPYSTEGMWFHDLAKRYPTPLEAAIEYLESVKGSAKG